MVGEKGGRKRDKVGGSERRSTEHIKRGVGEGRRMEKKVVGSGV